MSSFTSVRLVGFADARDGKQQKFDPPLNEIAWDVNIGSRRQKRCMHLFSVYQTQWLSGRHKVAAVVGTRLQNDASSNIGGGSRFDSWYKPFSALLAVKLPGTS